MFTLPSGQSLAPNILALCLQPDEGIHLRFEAKVPGTAAETCSVNMDFHCRDSFGPSAIPEAYKRLLLDALHGDASLFTRRDRIELAWGLLDPIIAGWHQPGGPPLAIYERESWDRSKPTNIWRGMDAAGCEAAGNMSVFGRIQRRALRHQ